jgi:hypothetical protein
VTSPAISSSCSPLNPDQVEDLQAFLKDWLRHTGRTQADLRRALRAASIRMPVLLEALQDIHQAHGLLGMVDRLCSIEAIWQEEDQGGSPSRHDLDEPPDSFGQLDLLLQEIREDRHD